MLKVYPSFLQHISKMAIPCRRLTLFLTSFLFVLAPLPTMAGKLCRDIKCTENSEFTVYDGDHDHFPEYARTIKTTMFGQTVTIKILPFHKTVQLFQKPPNRKSVECQKSTCTELKKSIIKLSKILVIYSFKGVNFGFNLLHNLDINFELENGYKPTLSEYYPFTESFDLRLESDAAEHKIPFSGVEIFSPFSPYITALLKYFINNGNIKLFLQRLLFDLRTPVSKEFVSSYSTKQQAIVRYIDLSHFMAHSDSSDNIKDYISPIEESALLSEDNSLILSFAKSSFLDRHSEYEISYKPAENENTEGSESAPGTYGYHVTLPKSELSKKGKAYVLHQLEAIQAKAPVAARVKDLKLSEHLSRSHDISHAVIDEEEYHHPRPKEVRATASAPKKQYDQP